MCTTAKCAEKPKLVVFSDSSSVAYAAVIYVIFEVPQDEDGPWSSGLSSRKTYDSRLLLSKARVTPLGGMTVPPTEMNGLVLAIKLLDLALVSMSEPPTSVTFCLDSECTISAVKSENGLLRPYLANRRAVVIGKLQEWKTKFPDTDFESLQHIAGPLNPADLPTQTTCTALDVGKDTLWQN